MPKAKETPDAKEKVAPFKKSSFKKYLLSGGIIVILVSLLGASFYFYSQYQKTQSLLHSSSKGNQAEIASLVEKVSKHYVLPTGEEPTVASVSDSTKLKGQTFFAQAQNGDKVLIFTKAKKAILYRPSTDRVIEVGPVGRAEGEVPAQEQQATVPVKIVLYNGTTTAGLTRRAEAELLELSSLRAEILAKENASSSAYPESIIVDLTGKNKQAATQLASLAKGKVASLPSGESKPEGADILIILGQAYVSALPTATPTQIPTE